MLDCAVARNRLKLLIDTNILIPLEPTDAAHLHQHTAAAAQLVALATETGTQLYRHPAVRHDLGRDKDSRRRHARDHLLSKYPSLHDPPPASTITAIVSDAPYGTNDWVDNQLLAALYRGAVDFLVSEDHGVFRKAIALGIDDRVFTIDGAIAHLSALFDRAPVPPPAVRSTKAYALNERDPIFSTFREDYAPDFDSWLSRCKREHRQTWIIDKDNRHAGIAIVNEETESKEIVHGRTLKICSFKIADEFRGFRFGELLLKAIFEHAYENRYESLYVTAFPKQEELIALFRSFGFHLLDRRTKSGELVLGKLLQAPRDDTSQLSPLEYNIRFGPRAMRRTRTFVVPIQPHFARVLFPESETVSELFPGRFPFGNGLRKAYLSKSPLQAIVAGDTLFFYRSRERQGLVAAGVVEQVVRSVSPEDIARAVGKRAVYTFDEIAKMCSGGSVLALLFRQARVLSRYLPVADLKAAKVFKRPPQSIMQVTGEEGLAWLYQQIRR